MKTTTIAVDVAKSVFEIAVSERPGRVSERHRLSRAAFLRFFVQRPKATVLMESCCSAHHWARQLEGLGHRVLLLPPHRTRPYVTGNKTDRTDAKGLLEAQRNEQIQPVPVKSVDQQALASLHRFRTAWVAARTARINTVRGLLYEFGITMPLGAKHVVPRVQQLLEDADSGVPDCIRPTLHEATLEIQDLTRRVRFVEHQLSGLSGELPVVHKLQTVPGVGLLGSTALVAFVGDISRFRSGRHFASYLGLTPREYSSGLRRRLGSISKHGDAYIRTLLTHGARSVLLRAKSRQELDRLRAWALQLQARRGHNKAAIALANKMARVIWAVWKRDVEFVEQPIPNPA